MIHSHLFLTTEKERKLCRLMLVMIMMMEISLQWQRKTSSAQTCGTLAERHLRNCPNGDGSVGNICVALADVQGADVNSREQV